MKVTKTEEKRLSILKRFAIDTNKYGFFRNIKSLGIGDTSDLKSLGLIELISLRKYKWIGGVPTVEMVRYIFLYHCIIRKIDLSKRTKIKIQVDQITFNILARFIQTSNPSELDELEKRGIFSAKYAKIIQMNAKEREKSEKEAEKETDKETKNVCNKRKISKNDIVILKDCLDLIPNVDELFNLALEFKQIDENDSYILVKEKYKNLSLKYNITDIENFRKITEIL